MNEHIVLSVYLDDVEGHPQCCSTKRNLLRLRTPVIKHHQQIHRIQSIQTRPHAHGLANGDLISPRRTRIRTRDELSRSSGEIARCWGRQFGILIRLETHNESAVNSDDLRRTRARVATARRVDGLPIAPGFAVVCGCYGCDGEQSCRFGLEDGHEVAPSNGGHAGHAVAGGHVSA